MESNEVSGYQNVLINTVKEQELSENDFMVSPFLGPSTSTFCGYEIIDLENTSNNQNINDNEVGIQDVIQNIEEPVDKGEKVPDRKKGIVLQIINDKGNLTSKHVSKRTKFNDFADDSLQSAKNANACSECSTYFDSLEELVIHNCINNYLFQCDKCQKHFESLNHLLNHIKGHHETKIPQEYEMLLSKQLEAIEKVKNTAYELMNINRHDAVKTLLETSKKSLDSFKIDIFGKGDTNLFKMYVISVYKEIYNELNKHKYQQAKLSTKIKKNNLRKKRKTMYLSDKKKKFKKSTRKSAKISKRNKVKFDFSSEDELCLKDSILKSRETEVKDESMNEDYEKECDELYLQFYAIPYKSNGSLISLYDFECLRLAVKSMWDGVHTDLSAFQDIMIRRFEWELDEVLPDDALFSGYAVKENISIFTNPKNFSDIFDENFFLNDEKTPHIFKIQVNTKLDIDETSTEANLQNGYEHATIESESESNDTYKPTEFLSKDSHASKKCDICEEAFPQARLLNKHMEEFHIYVNKQLSCKICNVILLSRSKLWKHFKIHAKKIYECEVCCETFVLEDEKKTHTTSCHRNNSIKCAMCNAQYDDLSKLEKHFAKMHKLSWKDSVEKISKTGNTSSPTCASCNRVFTSLGRLSQHMATKHQK